MKRIAWLVIFAAAGCLSTGGITYALDPQEFQKDFGNATGNFPDAPCAANPSVCNMVAPPPGFTASCDATTGKCAASFDLRQTLPVNISQQKGFPSSAVSAVSSLVKVDSVRFWTPTNTLTFTTPAIDIYVGNQAAQKETDPGVKKLGTLPSLAAMTRACPTQDSGCTMPLTDDGRNALAILAQDYQMPFTVIAVAHIAVKAGDAVPAGVLDLFIQPVIAFGL